LIVPKFQSSAVARNRLRRRLKELMRRLVLPGMGPLDVVLRARRDAYRAKVRDLRADLIAWLERVPNMG